MDDTHMRFEARECNIRVGKAARQTKPRWLTHWHTNGYEGPKRFLVIIAVIAAGVLLGNTTAAGGPPCRGVDINPGNDLDAIVNANPSGTATTFCVHAASSGTTYTVNNTVQLRAGDKLIGDAGATTTRGPATYGRPLVKINDGANNLSRIFQLTGANIQIKWVDISGGSGKYVTPQPSSCANWGSSGKCPKAGTGMAIGAGKADGTLVMEHLRIHHNDALGIGSMNGHLFHSEFFSNSSNPDWWGFESAAVKGVDEYEAAYNYFHDEQANGLWCDHACANVSSQPNGFWVHDNLIVGNDRWGIRYEYSPIVSSGVHRTQPSALIEDNEIHGNGKSSTYGGASMVDAQNALFRNNNFGAATIAGVSYPKNYGNRAILFADSGRSNRTDLWNGEATGNTLGGEAISGCSKPDNVVYCANNR